MSLREKCPKRSFFWTVFSRIWTEYGEILRIYPYSVGIRENTNQEKLRIWTLSRSVFALKYGDKPHAQECIFQRSRPSKINFFPSDATMVEPRVATKLWNFYSPELLSLWS